MSNRNKLIAIVVVSFLAILVTKNINPKSTNNITINGIQIDRTPYLGLVNQMFGESVDSNKTCDCLLEAYYDIIQHDSSKLEAFRKSSLFIIDSVTSNSVHAAFARCVLSNIRDTAYKLKFSGTFMQVFLQELKSELKNYPEFKGFNADTIANCISSKLDGNITIKEYYKEDTLTTSKFKPIFRHCIFEEKERLGKMQ
jgi:hypothetical protein